MPTNTSRRVVWTITLLSLLWAAVLALDLVPSLRGDYGWRWPYAFPPEHPWRLVWLALALCAYAVGAFFTFRLRRAVPIIVWALVGSVVLAVITLYVTVSDPGYELYTRTASPGTTGWHYAAAEIDENGGLVETLKNWPAFMESHNESASHVSVSPPGIPLIYYVTNRLLDRVPAAANWLGRPLRAEQCHNLPLMNDSNAELASAWLGILTPLWAGLAVLPLYWLGRRLYGDTAARWSVIWWPLVPSLLMFTPTPSVVYPLFSLLVIASLVEGIERQQPVWVVVSGVLMSILTFLNLTILPLLLLAGFLTLGAHLILRKERRLTWWWSLVTGLWFGAGLVSVWGVYYLVSGVPVWEIYAAIMRQHFVLVRSYLPWLFLHLNDFFMFTGWPLILLSGWGIWQAAQALRGKAEWSTGKMVSLAAPATILALDLSGASRGESGRVWLFLAPFLLLGAADTLTGDKDNRSGWIITAVQAVMVLVMVGFVHVIDSGLSKPPAAPPILAQSPQTDYLLSGSVFDGALRLERFAGHVEARRNADGDAQPVLILWLDWQSTGQVDTSYYLSFIPVAPDGQAAPQATLLPPFNTGYPTTCWLPSSGPIRDRYEIPLFVTSAQGDWWVSLSLVDGLTGEQPPVALPDGSQDVQVGIGPFSQD